MRQLIGDAHWLSDGHHKEELVREFLRRHLPPRLRVSRGFVCPSLSTSPVSPEIDILISDSENELPWFCEGGLTIVPPSSLKAHIHIKTKYEGTEIRDILASCHAVHEACSSQTHVENIWSGAIFFSSPGIDYSTALSRLIDQINLEFQGREMSASSFPNCICLVEGATILSDKPSDSDEYLTFRSFDSLKHSIAILLNNLYEHCRTPIGRRGEWNRLFEGLSMSMSEETIKIAPRTKK